MKPWDEAVATAQEKVRELRALLKALEITDAEPALDRIEEGIREKEKERTQEERLRYLSKFMTLSALSPDNDEMLTAVQAEVEALIVHRDLDKLAPYEKILHFIEQPEQYDPAGKMRLLMELQKESMQDTLLSCVFFAQGELFFSEEKGREKNPSPAPKTGRSKRDRHGAKHVSTQHPPVTGASAIADIPREKPTKNAEESSTNEIEPKIERRIEPPTGETDRTPHIETVPEGWSMDIPERAGKKFSFSEFQHALSKKTIVEQPYITGIAAELSAFGVSSADASMMHGKKKEHCDTILIQKAEDFLYRKGYAVRCTFGSRHFLSPSKRLGEGASTEKMQRWSINHMGRGFPTCAYTDDALRILTRLFFVDSMFYLQKYHTAMTPEDYSCVSVGESYTAVLHEKDQILAMTVLSPADEEAFIETLEGRFKDWPSIQRIIVGGLDFSHAGKTAERVQKTFPALHAATVVLYDLQGHYAAYPDMEETDEASAWGLSAGDDTTQASEDERSTNDARESVAPLDASDEVPIDPVKKEPDTIDLQEEEHVYADRQAEAFIADEPTAPDTPAERMERALVVQSAEPPHAPTSDELCALLQAGKLYCAAAYARAAGELDPAWRKLSVRLAYAVHDPMESCRYTGDRLYEVYDADTSDVYGLEAPLFAAAALRACFYNQQAHDYSMKPLYSDVVKRLPLMETLKDLGTAFYQMAQFREQTGLGIDAAADYRRKDKNDLAKEMAAIQMRAEEYRNGYLNPANIKDTASFKRFINTQQLIFSPSGDFAACIQAITDGAVDSDTLDFMRGFLGQFTDEGDLPEESAVSDAALEDFIALHWDKAAETLQHKKNTVRLVSTRLTKLKNRITAGLEPIRAWIKCAAQMETAEDGTLSAVYAKAKKELMPLLKNAMEELRVPTVAGKEEAAGRVVLGGVVEELIARLDGTWKEVNPYVNFLLTDDVLIDEQRYPVLAHAYDALPHMGILPRILRHAENVEAVNTGDAECWRNRLRSILTEKGDNCGSAGMIIDLLRERGQMDEAEAAGWKLDETVVYSLKDAVRNKKKFMSELALYQSYGQISSVTGAKDELIALVGFAFEEAAASRNFGFFRSVIEACKQKVRLDSTKRGEKITQEVEEFKKQLGDRREDPTVRAGLEKIENMLKKRNYTVVSGLMNSMKRGDFPQDAGLPEQNEYLSDFMNEYENYYHKVQRDGWQKTFPQFTSNKEGRGGARLIENWSISGSRNGAQKLENLLQALGFTGVTAKPDKKVYPFELYQVSICKPAQYMHPIGAFGSEAVASGFRVAIIAGRYDANALLTQLRVIDMSKNTLIFLDHALSKPDRRQLARKIKEARMGRVIAVIDRVMLGYLARKYDVTHIGSMLMYLSMPFSACQPYVSRSAQAIPPEMFMGRAAELERIKSPDGANIIYGGRQLGKSALLRMAKNVVDKDSAGNRAVLVDIKECGFVEAAKRVGAALVDEGILEESCDVSDWDNLARAVCRRLNDEKDRIPYLLLLMDEGDAFLESCADVNYAPFDALKRMQSVGQNRFKFVLAGLHDVVRFNTKRALGNNSVITHLEPLTVKPFNEMEARELLEIPLGYLGIRFKNEELIYLICASANYFPGLIQFYCAKLVEKLCDGDYAGFDQADTPPYYVTEEQIQRVLSDPVFTEQVKEKFMITLRLDADNYYYIIALLLASLYHSRHAGEGYTAEDILVESRDYGLEKLSAIGEKRLTAYMDEMDELNVLSRTRHPGELRSRYLFSMYNFLELMGTKEDIETQLIEILEGEQSA